MQTINLDLSVKSIVPILYAKQAEVGRKFKVVLTDNGSPFAVPAGANVSIWFDGASGAGNYTDIGEQSAISVSGNEITVEMITQMLAKPGNGNICLVINGADCTQIATWNIPYFAEKLPGVDSEKAQQYYTAFSEVVKLTKDAAENADRAASNANAVAENLLQLRANGELTGPAGPQGPQGPQGEKGDDADVTLVKARRKYVEEFKTDSNTWDDAFAELFAFCEFAEVPSTATSREAQDRYKYIACTGSGYYSLTKPLYIGDINVDFENCELSNAEALSETNPACVVLTGAQNKIFKFGVVTAGDNISILVNNTTKKFEYNTLYAKRLRGYQSALAIVPVEYYCDFNEFHIPHLCSSNITLKLNGETKWVTECHFYLGAFANYKSTKPHKFIEANMASRCSYYNVDIEEYLQNPDTDTAIELIDCTDCAFYNIRLAEERNAIQFKFVGNSYRNWIDAQYCKFGTIDCSEMYPSDYKYNVLRGSVVTTNSGSTTNADVIRVYNGLIVPETITHLVRPVTEDLTITDDLLMSNRYVDTTGNTALMYGMPTLIQWSGGDLFIDKRFIALLPTTIQIMRVADTVGSIYDTDGNLIITGSALELDTQYPICVTKTEHMVEQNDAGKQSIVFKNIIVSVGDPSMFKEVVNTYKPTIVGFPREVNGVFSTSANGRRTDYIPLKGATKIIGLAGFNSACGVLSFYNSNKRFLSSISPEEAGINGANEGVFEIDVTGSEYAEAAYFVFATYRSSLQTYQYTFDDDYCSLITHVDTRKRDSYKIGHNTIAFFGDSITEGSSDGAGGGYPALIASVTDAIAANYGVGGAPLATGTTATTNIATLIDSYTGSDDIICISGGFNDRGLNVPLGALTTGYADELDTTTVIGALEHIFRKLLTDHATAKIYYVITHKGGSCELNKNGLGLTFTDYHEAIVSVLKKYSIPYYDAFEDSGFITSKSAPWGETLSSLYTINADGVHPNEDGYMKYYVYPIISMMERGY